MKLASPVLLLSRTQILRWITIVPFLFSSSTECYNDNMRAWTCHGRTQREMAERLRQAGIIHSDAVFAVLTQVDRKNYVPANIAAPYQDTPLSIGLGQTISAPHMHAHALEELLPYALSEKQEDNGSNEVKVLDVGCGSGYLTACLGRWFKSRHPDKEPAILHGKIGRVFGIDIYEDLVQMTKRNIQKDDSDLLKDHTVTLQVANGWQGLPDHAPFDAIHVGAAAAEFPRLLAQQLKVGGVLICPIGPQLGAQALYKVERIGNSSSATATDGDKTSAEFDAKDYRLTELLGVRYVPLIEQPSGVMH